MRKFASVLIVLVLTACGHLAVQAQTTGSIAGTVVDQNGAVIPNAAVTVKGESGQEFTAITSENGTYRIPAVQNGIYMVTVTTTGFKRFVVSNVKVDVGLPTTVDAALEVGGSEQIVEVTSGGEVLQTETAAISRNITGRQITETPIASRDALDLVLLMPGTNSVGAPRRSSINGLPKGYLNISIDGVDVQDNLLRSSDGFFTYVRPRVDAIDEVTISTANPGAESGGDGAVQIKFVTKRGTNDYRGGLFYQHRNTALNANYFFLNRDGQRDENGKALRQKIQLNQYGGRLGGPIPFPHIGEGGPFFHSGKDKAFFFFNYEQFRQPESNSRTRVILTPDAQAGNFSYITTNGVQTRNIYTIAAAGNCGTTAAPLACTSTSDPMITSLLTRIRTATGTAGTLTPITGDPNRLNYNFTPAGGQIRKFLALRFDFNLTKNNSLEFVTNRQKFDPSKDFLNSQEERFPGFSSYAQGSSRNSYSTALRSTITNNLINEARYAVSTGLSEFSPGISAADFDYASGYDLGSGTGTAGIQIAGITGPTSRNSYSNRNTPTYDFTDSVNWIKGSHNINFGGQYKIIRAESTAINRIVPTVNFGIDSSETGAFGLFNSTTLPGSTPTQQAEARNLYAVLVGRVSGYTNTAYLTADGNYVLNGEQTQLSKQKTYGLFAQDSWKVRPNLTVNYGLRWQPQSSYIILSDNYARLNSFEDVYGVSGLGNIFKPGTLAGRVPTVVAMKKGESAYPSDNNNFAPSIGAVYSPDFNGKGILRSIFGSSGRSVFRGGYSISYVREGFALVGSILGANPGGNLSASRNTGIAGSFTVGTNLRDINNRNLTPNPFAATPAYPIALSTANGANAFDPDLKTGSVHSFSFGYQRELDKNTVVEFRYVGNRGYDLFRQHNINEFNTIENGFATEFGLAQANLYANEAAFNAGQTNRRFCPGVVNSSGACVVSSTNSTPVSRVPTFAYFGAGTGTSPLQIIQSYFSAPNSTNPQLPRTFDPSNAALYNNANFANATLVTSLSRNNPNLAGIGTTGFAGANFENNATRRQNAISNGLFSNFFYVNPTTANTGAFIVDNSAKSWYDSGVIELRRRLSDGLRFQASYVWGKAQSNSFQSNSDNFANFSNREDGLELAKNVAVFDIRHAFKFDATYDLPFGKGMPFFSNANGFVNAIVGGFSIYPTIRWQSGSPFSLGNVTLVGMTRKELQKEIKVRKDSIQNGVNVVTYLPDDIILNTQKAFNIDVSNTANNGYGTTFGTGGPTGRFIAPAGYGNCQQRYAGECGFNNLILYGPSFFKFDVSLSKKIQFDEKRNFELRATFLDALNHPNFRIGGWAADVATATLGGSTFGQLGNGTAYQDISTTNDPGGRLIDIMLRFNF
jgi:hypothetical protein